MSCKKWKIIEFNKSWIVRTDKFNWTIFHLHVSKFIIWRNMYRPNEKQLCASNFMFTFRGRHEFRHLKNYTQPIFTKKKHVKIQVYSHNLSKFQLHWYNIIVLMSSKLQIFMFFFAGATNSSNWGYLNNYDLHGECTNSQWVKHMWTSISVPTLFQNVSMRRNLNFGSRFFIAYQTCALTFILSSNNDSDILLFDDKRAELWWWQLK